MKTYSTLERATSLIIAEQGSPKNWNTSVDNLYSIYKSYLKTSKECGTDEGCFPQFNSTGYKRLNGNVSNAENDIWDVNQNIRKLVLSDGVQLLFEYDSSDCTSKILDDSHENICAAIWADINGTKAPNQMGRDLFGFVLKENGLYPVGCDNEDYCKITNSGYGCACRVLHEGKIDY